MPATTVETLIYKLEVEDNASKVFASVAKNVVSTEKALQGLTAAVNIPLAGVAALGKAALSVFSDMAKATTSFVVDSVKNFANYEDILTHAARTLDLTKEESLALGQALTALSNEALKGGVASEELARIAGVAGQLGIAKEDVLGFTETVAQMAAAFGISADKAAEGMAIILNVFKLSQEEMAGVGSAIALLGNSTAATADQIINITQRMGAVAEFMGLTAEQTTAIAATLRDVGVSVNVAGSSMSQILARIMSEHTKFAEVLGLNAETLRAQLESNDPSQALFSVLEALNQINQFGGKIEATQALKDLGLTGVRTQNTMLLLAGSVAELRENMALANQASSEGTALQDLYNVSIDTAKGRWNAFEQAISTVQKLIGGPLAEAFSQFLEEHVTPVILAFAEWMEQSPTFKRIMEEEIPNALAVLGEHTDAIAKKILDFLFDIDHDSEGAVNALIERFREWGTVAINSVGQAASSIVGFIANIQNLINWFNDTKRAAEDVWNTTKFFFEELNDDIQNFFMHFTDWWVIFERWNEETQFIQKAWQTLGDSIGIVIDTTKNSILDLVNVIKSALQPQIELIGTAFEKVGDIIFGNSVLPDTIEWTKKTEEELSWLEKRVDANGKSFLEMGQAAQQAMTEAMASTGQTLQNVGGLQNLSSQDLQQLIRTPGMFTGAGLMDANKILQQQLAASTPGIHTIDTSMPLNTTVPIMPNQQAPQTLNATVMLGDEAIGTIVTRINDENEQRSRRSFDVQNNRNTGKRGRI